MNLDDHAIASLPPEQRALLLEHRAEWNRKRKADLAALPKQNLSVEQADQFVSLYAGNDTRMGIVLSLRSRMEHDEWLSLLGRNWSMCDKIRDHFEILRSMLGSNGPLLPMMNAEEQAQYRQLTESLIVYRGCSAQFPEGASWSLNRNVAMKFPIGFWRYRVPDPVLLIGTVKKENVLALLLDREETGVISFDVRWIVSADVLSGG